MTKYSVSSLLWASVASDPNKQRLGYGRILMPLPIHKSQNLIHPCPLVNPYQNVAVVCSCKFLAREGKASLMCYSTAFLPGMAAVGV